MFRRSRFSVRPNVGTAGRAAATPQDAPSATQEAGETPKDVSESSTAPAVTDNTSAVTPSETPAASGDGNDQNGEGSSSSAAVQRRKRFSIKPKVVPGRPSAVVRTPKSPIKVAPEAPIEVSDLDKPTTSSQTASPHKLQSPRRRRPSEDSKQPKLQPKADLIPSEPSAVPAATEDSAEQPPLTVEKESESTSGKEVKEIPFKTPDKVPPSLPDREAFEISEKAKTLVSFKSGLSLSQPAMCLSRLLNDPSDLQRLAKARKLRELLKEEMHKEKKLKRAKARVKEYTLDPTKMTMRDLIRYLPLSNPMSSSLEESVQENETVVPPSPTREASPEKAQEPAVTSKVSSPREDEEAEVEAEEEEDDGIMVPQVKVAEDGTLIIDEESLTVEVQRAKGPNPAQDRDPIFERGSTTTYSSFRKVNYCKPWSSEETDMFFLAISMVGTDFSMICQLFPHRPRSEIKNKFKKEERENSWRIDKAFRDRRKLDIEYFSKLLEKILEVQKNRKKLKTLAVKSPKEQTKKAKGKKAARKLSVVEEEDEEEQTEMPDFEEEGGEKENKDLCNEGGTSVAKPKKKRKRKNKEETSTEEPQDKKNKMGEESSEQGEACIPEDAEAALPEDSPNTDMSEHTENAAKDTTVKPAKLSRGRAPKPLLPLGRKWGKKTQPATTKGNNTASDKGDESVIDEASEEQVNNDASLSREANKRKSANDDSSSEEEDTSAEPPKPTRYGRVPKPTKPLNYPAKEASESTPDSPAGASGSAAKRKPKSTAKRARSSKAQSAQESKRPKLVTLRASQSEYSDEEDERQREDEEVELQPACSSSQDSSAPVFVPASLRSPHPVHSEVEETMEELNILRNMPDMLGISKDALCPDASCERAQSESYIAEPGEHQLDLLVDVIDILTSENAEVLLSEDESYNEAAQTLLAIGNLAHLSQPAQNQIAMQDHITVAGTTSVSVNESYQHQEEEIASMLAAQEESTTPLVSANSVHGVLETPETVDPMELQNSTTDNDDMRAQLGPSTEQATTETIPIWESTEALVQESSDHLTPCVTPVEEEELPVSQKGKNEVESTGQTRKSRFQKVKPNVGQTSRTVWSEPQTTKDTVEKASNPTLGTSQSYGSALDLIPSLDLGSTVAPSEELSTTQDKKTDDKVIGHVESGGATSDQSASENQNFSEALFEPNKEQSNEKLVSREPLTAESNNPLTSDITATELQVDQGSNKDSVLVQDSSTDPAPCVGKLPVTQKEESNAESTSQIRRGRLPKVKPNLPQTSRTLQSKPQTTKDPVTPMQLVEKPPRPESTDNTIAEVEAEPTCNTSPSEKTSQIKNVSVLLLKGYPTHKSTEELSSIEDNKTDVKVIGKEESGALTSDQSVSENQNFSEAQFESSRKQATRDTTPTLESTDEKLMSYVGTAESTCNNLLTSDVAVTESQVGKGSNIDSVPVQESSDHPASCVTHVEELPVGEKEECEVKSAGQSRRARFPKVKPKLPQTTRTVLSKPQTTKYTVEKDSNPSPDPKFHEKTQAEVEAGQASQNRGLASDLTPSVGVGPTVTPSEELRTTDEVKTDVGVVGLVESGGGVSNQRASGNHGFPEAQFEPSREQATRDTRPTPESMDQKVVSHVGTAESNTQLASGALVTESQVGQGSSKDSVPVQESGDHPSPCVQELPVSQKEESEVKSTCQARRVQLQKIKPKPNLPQTSRTVQSKPSTTKDPVTTAQLAKKPPKLQTTEDTIADGEAQPTCTTAVASVSVASLEVCSTSKPTEKLSSMEEQKTDAGCGLDSNSESSEQNVPQRRRRFPKVKPNLGSSPRTTHIKLKSDSVIKPPEQGHMDTSSTSEQPVDNNKVQTELRLTADSKTSTELSSTMLGPPEKSLDSTNDKGTSSDASSWVAENRSVLTDTVLENKSREKLTVEGESTEMSLRATNTTTEPKEDPTPVSDVHRCTQTTLDPTESTQQSRSEEDLAAQSQDAIQQCSEANQTAAQSTDNNQSEPTDCPSRKGPLIRRGRLIKPKPTLVHSSRPRQQGQNTKQAEADAGIQTEVMGASVSQPVSEHQPDSQEPVEGAIEQPMNQNSTPNEAGSSLGGLKQVIGQLTHHEAPPNVTGSSLGCVTVGRSTQDASIPSTVGTQSHPSLTLFPDLLSQQVPSDPDEPFFILSLTEIPVSSSGEVLGSVPEPLPYLPVTDASVEQQSVPGESSAVAGHDPLSLSNVIPPVSTGPDPAAYIGPIMQNPVDPHESTAIHPSQLPETLEKNDGTKISPTKQRRAKQQVKPNTTRRKQASKTSAAKEAESVPIQINTTQLSELPGPSVQPKDYDDIVSEPQKGSGDHVEGENGEDPEDGRSGGQTKRKKGTGSRKRKPKGVLPETVDAAAPLRDSPPGKPASKGPKVKTPRTSGKNRAPVASTSHDVAPTEETHSPSSPKQTEVDAQQTSTPSCPAEISVSQQSLESSSVEQEPTSVSQYFLSDIFTDVEEP